MKTPTDTEMLDWLEKQGNSYMWNAQTEKDFPFVRGCFFLNRNSTSGLESAREAISKAMERSASK